MVPKWDDNPFYKTTCSSCNSVAFMMVGLFIIAIRISLTWEYGQGARAAAIRAFDYLGLFEGKTVSVGFIPYGLNGSTLMVAAGKIMEDLALLELAGVTAHGEWHVSA